MKEKCRDRYYTETASGFLAPSDHSCHLAPGHLDDHCCVPCNFSWSQRGMSRTLLQHIEERVRTGERWIGHHPLTGDWKAQETRFW